MLMNASVNPQIPSGPSAPPTGDPSAATGWTSQTLAPAADPNAPVLGAAPAPAVSDHSADAYAKHLADQAGAAVSAQTSPADVPSVTSPTAPTPLLSQADAVAQAAGTPFAVSDNAATHYVQNLASNRTGNLALAAGLTAEQAAKAPQQKTGDLSGGGAFSYKDTDGAKGAEMYRAYLTAVGHEKDVNPGTLVRWMQDSLGYDSVAVDSAMQSIRDAIKGGHAGADCQAMYKTGDSTSEILTIIDRVYVSATNGGNTEHKYQNALGTHHDGWNGMDRFMQDLDASDQAAGSDPIAQASAGTVKYLPAGSDGKPQTDAWSLAAAVTQAGLLTANDTSAGNDLQNKITGDVGGLAVGVAQEVDRVSSAKKLEPEDLSRINGDVASTLRLMGATQARAAGQDVSSAAIDANACMLGNALAEIGRSAPSAAEAAASAGAAKYTFGIDASDNVTAQRTDDSGTVQSGTIVSGDRSGTLYFQPSAGGNAQNIRLPEDLQKPVQDYIDGGPLPTVSS